MKKAGKKILLASGIMLIPAISIWLCKPSSGESLKEENSLKEKTIAMYVQNEDGGYDTSSSTKFPTDGYVLNLEKSSCRNGGVLSQDRATKKISLSVTNADACTLYFDIVVTPTPDMTLAALKVSSNGVQTTSFANAATTAEGIFEMEDDYGTSYYYRGAVENNYVKFAGFYWRIIRINGDGSLRILYDGTQAYANGTSNNGRVALTSIAYHPNYNDAKYVGYMFGGASGTASTSKAQAQTNQTDSNIKTKVDEWYKTNIADKGYGSAVADAIFCNDRSTPGKDVTGWSSDTGLGYAGNYTAYGAIGRLYKGFSSSAVPAPSFKCPQKNDAFTVSDTEKGNGALTYPVGLITADEIVAAGSGKYNTTNQKYYLYKTSSYFYWSLSPCCFNGTYAYVFDVYTSGQLYYNYVYNGGAVVPVINLSAEYTNTLVGEGTMNNPYESM